MRAVVPCGHLRAHGDEGRIRAARFPARKSLDEFGFDHARGLKRDLIAHLGTLDCRYTAGERGVPGSAGHRKTHLVIGSGIRAREAGHGVLFATAAESVVRLADAHHGDRLQCERLGGGFAPRSAPDARIRRHRPVVRQLLIAASAEGPACCRQHGGWRRLQASP